MNQTVEVFSLVNGIRIAYLYCRSAVAYCGLTINAGTRDELAREYGIAHFLEHTLFKGTQKRRAYHINNRLESVGGELNAYTTKEETVIHASVLKGDLAKAIELIADITFNSTFPEKEIEKEKIVICDEIDSYLDNPSDLIFDDFDDLIFAGSALGHSILGKKRMVKKFESKDILRFITRTYNTNEMVFALVGQTPVNKFRHWCEMYFADKASNPRTFARSLLGGYQPFYKKMNKSTYQAHCIMGNRAYGITHKQRTALSMLVNLLGGPMSNSLLNSLLREKHGLVYNIEANYNVYSDTGAASIYFGTSKQNLEQSMELVRTELRKACTTALSATQLHRAKKQLVGQLTIACESGEQQMLSMGRNVLNFNGCDTMAATVARVQATTALDLMACANEIFDEQQLSTLIYT